MSIPHRHFARYFTVLTIFVAGLVSAQASAQPGFSCEGENLLALVLDNGEIFAEGVPLNMPVVGHIYVLNPSAESIRGVEFSLNVPANCMAQSVTWDVQAVDVGSGNNHIVGFGTPVFSDGTHIHLGSVPILYMDPDGDPASIYLGPSVPSSIDGSMSYAQGETSELVSLQPVSGDLGLPVLRINGAPLHYCLDLADYDLGVVISTPGDPFNLAAVLPEATDGYDPGLDLPDTDEQVLITFNHPEWSSPRQLKHDIRSPFDPELSNKTWFFTYQAPAAGVYPAELELHFETNLAVAAGAPATVRDIRGNTTIDLHSQDGYTFIATAPSQIRNFILEVGTPALPPLTFTVDVALAGHTDQGNTGGFEVGATDGFDADFDLPQPAPQPEDFLVASFDHPEWPLGDRYWRDIRAPFDPVEEERTWPFVVETDLDGLATLNFTPDFAAYEGATLVLHDLQNGRIVDLMAAPSYTFTAEGMETIYEFIISVGGDVPEPPPLEPESRYLPVGWSMVGFPLQPPAGQDNLGDMILDQSPDRAFMFRHAGNAGYEQVGTGTGTSVGDGFWIAPVTGYSWSMAGTPRLGSSTVDLGYGWNLVGYPLWFTGHFSGIQGSRYGSTYTWDEMVDQGLISHVVWSYDPDSGSYLNAQELEPWHGYWIRTAVYGLNLEFSWQNFTRGGREGTTAAQLAAGRLVPPELRWKTELQVSGTDGGADAVTVGVHPTGTPGFDPLLDLPRAPAGPDRQVRISAHRPEWEDFAGTAYATDFTRAGGKDPWNLLVEPAGDGPVTLTWERQDWPADLDFQLYLPEQNRVVVRSMAQQNSVVLEPAGQPLLVRVRTPDLMSGTEEMPPTDFALRVRPNPFNPSAEIAFNLPQAGDVEVRIYSLRGELVDVIAAGSLAAGRNHVTWHGRDRNGRDVPSGTYFARLLFGGEVRGSVQKLMLVR